MTRLVWATLFIALIAPTASADTAEELDKWFRVGYAALYEKDSWDHKDEFAQYFADEIVVQSSNGRTVEDINSFAVDLLDGWRDEGWVGTDVAGLKTKLLNETTAVFDVKWLDRNDDGSTEVSCGWYFADNVDGTWLLSQYIAMECASED